MHYVYVLQLSNHEYYIGESSNLKRRIKEHASGTERTTKKYLPCKLICYLALDSKQKAKKFEKYLKSGSGFAFRNRHLV